jgi:hypothetical protein
MHDPKTYCVRHPADIELTHVLNVQGQNDENSLQHWGNL